MSLPPYEAYLVGCSWLTTVVFAIFFSLPQDPQECVEKIRSWIWPESASKPALAAEAPVPSPTATSTAPTSETGPSPSASTPPPAAPTLPSSSAPDDVADSFESLSAA